ncbi:hypothetical protein BB561_004671 [Smittium simulii]|uniref:Uncharacterized protein n=1 Tax=Smittium simulii TaxID=133385 RepID=A0A2T9YEW2_9FUNG|nr:hypothetical protein BB561_004671 [Smittium simulii]
MSAFLGDSDTGTDVTVQVEAELFTSLVITNSSTQLAGLVATVVTDLSRHEPVIAMQAQAEQSSICVRFHDADTGALLDENELVGTRSVLIVSYCLENDGIQLSDWTCPERTTLDAE